LAFSTTFIWFESAIAKYTTQPPRSSKTDLDSRIRQLVAALSDASAAIASIESEIESRRHLVDSLESQKRIAENAITLSKAQVDAVAQLLKLEITQSDQRSERRDYLLFGGGVLVSAIVALTLRLFGI
jgi:chromosome segregation ATPase